MRGAAARLDLRTVTPPRDNNISISDKKHCWSGTKGIYPKTKGVIVLFFVPFYVFFLYKHISFLLSKLPYNSFHLRRQMSTNQSPWSIWPFPVPWQSVHPAGPPRPGLCCTAAGAGGALCAADAVGRTAVFWGRMRLLDLLRARRPTCVWVDKPQSSGQQSPNHKGCKGNSHHCRSVQDI